MNECAMKRWELKTQRQELQVWRAAGAGAVISLSEDSVHQPRVLPDSAPKCTAQPHDYPGSEQQKDVRDGKWSIFWFGPPQKEVTWMSVVHTAASGQVDVHGSCCLLRQCCCVCGLCYNLRPCWCPWFMLPTRDHVDVCDPYCGRALVDVHGPCYYKTPYRS